jgi:hypothetical protein
MICPLLLAAAIASQHRTEQVSVECLEKDCAWYTDDIYYKCAIHAIAKKAH